MPSARADEQLSGLAIMEQLVGRDEGKQVSRDLKMELTARSGTSRIQHTRSFRKYFGKEKRTVIFYLKPTNVKGTGFLTYDYPDPAVDDDQWLYLPALRKVRQVKPLALISRSTPWISCESWLKSMDKRMKLC